ncbi:MAG: hypothetical protein HXL50_04245 [Solobacterium sp.]|jgi:hypothetical protein|nr:hypothetical protein [Solobacterium sp.]
MKALLIFEFEMFIKKKQYIFPIAYLIFTIAYVLYMMKVKLSHDVFYNIFFTTQLINAFARREQPMKGSVIRLVPISAKTRVNTLFIEIVILNIIILLGLLIYYISFHEIDNMWFVLNIIVLNEALVIPAILPVEIWHRNYFQHLGILLVVIGVAALIYTKTNIHPIIQFLGYATVLYTLAYISSIRILTNKD